jgi:hypothetical protein
MDLRGRGLLTITDLSAEEFMYLVELGRKLRPRGASGSASTSGGWRGGTSC